MATLRALVVLPFLSGKPEDVVVNTFHFSSASADEAARTSIVNQLKALYNDPVSPGASIASHLSNAINRGANACKIKLYNLADPLPRPVTSYDWTLLPSQTPSGTELPAEVAVVGSFYAGRNIPRYRGRVYFGPFHTGVILDAANERSRPGTSLVDSIRFGLGRMMLQGPLTQNLAVFSRVDNEARTATAGWVDDAWDTQRRRGQDSMVRWPCA